MTSQDISNSIFGEQTNSAEDELWHNYRVPLDDNQLLHYYGLASEDNGETGNEEEKRNDENSQSTSEIPTFFRSQRTFRFDAPSGLFQSPDEIDEGDTGGGDERGNDENSPSDLNSQSTSEIPTFFRSQRTFRFDAPSGLFQDQSLQNNSSSVSCKSITRIVPVEHEHILSPRGANTLIGEGDQRIECPPSETNSQATSETPTLLQSPVTFRADVPSGLYESHIVSENKDSTQFDSSSLSYKSITRIVPTEHILFPKRRPSVDEVDESLKEMQISSPAEKNSNVKALFGEANQRSNIPRPMFLAPVPTDLSSHQQPNQQSKQPVQQPQPRRSILKRPSVQLNPLPQSRTLREIVLNYNSPPQKTLEQRRKSRLTIQEPLNKYINISSTSSTDASAVFNSPPRKVIVQKAPPSRAPLSPLVVADGVDVDNAGSLFSPINGTTPSKIPSPVLSALRSGPRSSRRRPSRLSLERKLHLRALINISTTSSNDSSFNSPTPRKVVVQKTPPPLAPISPSVVADDVDVDNGDQTAVDFGNNYSDDSFSQSRHDHSGSNENSLFFHQTNNDDMSANSLGGTPLETPTNTSIEDNNTSVNTNESSPDVKHYYECVKEESPPLVYKTKLIRKDPASPSLQMGLRRSTRNRLPRLASWLGSKPLYRVNENGDHELVGASEVVVNDPLLKKHRVVNPIIASEKEQNLKRAKKHLRKLRAVHRRTRNFDTSNVSTIDEE